MTIISVFLTLLSEQNCRKSPQDIRFSQRLFSWLIICASEASVALFIHVYGVEVNGPFGWPCMEFLRYASNTLASAFHSGVDTFAASMCQRKPAVFTSLYSCKEIRII